MKIKVLSRNPDDYVRETKHELFKVSRNYAPQSHPLHELREYKRALNAAKLERVFAKPFVCSLDGHSDGVARLAKCHNRLSLALSGSYDGEICVWDIPQRMCLRRFAAHDGHVRGLSVDTMGGDVFTSVGDDMQVKMWRLDAHSCDDDPCSSTSTLERGRRLPTKDVSPATVMSSGTPLWDVCHAHKSHKFATCGDSVCLWSPQRSTPVRSIHWGVDTVHALRFNPIECDVLAACASDRSIVLYDVRGDAPLKRVTMKLRSNALCWNPMEAYVFTVANEDYNLYTFDMRKLSTPVRMHEDFTSAVMDVDYSPTGGEFVAGSYDKTLRIFAADEARSREVYHTKRMHRVLSVMYTLDAKFVLSASDEMNIRVWKANAAEKLGPLRPRERRALNYSAALRAKFAGHPEVRSIARHRHVPKHVHSAAGERHAMRLSGKRKRANRARHEGQAAKNRGRRAKSERADRVVAVE